VSDTRKFSSATGWRAKVTVAEGISRLYEWLQETRFPEQVSKNFSDANGHLAASTPANGDARLRKETRARRGSVREKLAKAV
jgi:hypothetical protein